ncbi:MAG: hypothetical protein AAF170_18075 [Bacteroidota bacterium]
MSADPLAVLQRYADEKAARIAAGSGERFREDEAEMDTRAVEMSQREKAARWGWTRQNVRTFEADGAPVLNSEQPKGNPAPTQNPANAADLEGVSTQRQPSATHPDPEPSRSIGFPPSPTGTAPQGGPREKIQSEPKPKPKPPPQRFRPPTDAEVATFAASHPDERYRRPELAGEFVDHFTANGWRVGGRAPMKDWKAAWRNWCRRAPQFARNGRSARLDPASGTLSESQKSALMATHGLVDADFYRNGTDERRNPVWALDSQALARIAS